MGRTSAHIIETGGQVMATSSRCLRIALFSFWLVGLVILAAITLASVQAGTRLLSSAEMREVAKGAVDCNTHFYGYLCQDQAGTCSRLDQTGCNAHPQCRSCTKASSYSTCSSDFPWNYYNCTVNVTDGGCGTWY